MTPRDAALLTESRSIMPVLTIQDIIDMVIEQKVRPAATAGKWSASSVFGLVDGEGRRVYLEPEDKRQARQLMAAAGWKFETDASYITWLSWDHHSTNTLHPLSMRDRIIEAKQHVAKVKALRGEPE